MPKSVLMYIRFCIIAYTAALCTLVSNYLMPNDKDVLDLASCVAEFISAYFLMTLLTLVFIRVRKFDLGLISGALLATSLLCQYAFFLSGQAPFPHVSQALSGAMGLLAYLVPMSVAKIRGEVRHDVQVARVVEAHRSIAPSHATHLIVH